jgi:hypothetical protein
MVENLAHILRRLAEEGDKMIAFFDSLPESDWDQRVYTTGSGWRIRQILAHFISSELAYQQAIQDVIQGGQGASDDLDIDRFNERETAALSLKPVPYLIEALRLCRADTIRIAMTLDDSDLTRTANHPWFGKKELGWFFKLLYRHQAMHLSDVRKALATRAPLPHVERFRDIS